MQLILAVAPPEVSAASKHGFALAHAAYRIGTDSTLLRQNAMQYKGGFLMLSDCNAPVIEQPEALCAAVIRECGRRSFRGVILDFEEAPKPDRFAFAKLLAQTFAKEKRILFLPESYGAIEQAFVLLCTAISGGDYTQRLREAADRYGGAKRLALDVQRLRMDFSLPAPTGEGTPLTGEELRQLTEQEQSSVFFSPALCARYFTYARNGQAHFVLFDDAETMQRKIKIGASLGFSAALFMWPEVRDIADGLKPR